MHEAILPYSDVNMSLQTWFLQIYTWNSSRILTEEWVKISTRFVQIYSEMDLQWHWMVRGKHLKTYNKTYDSRLLLKSMKNPPNDKIEGTDTSSIVNNDICVVCASCSDL